MFTRGFWRHERFMDVAFEITYVVQSTSDKAILHGRWWNLGYSGNPWMLFGTKDRLFLRKDVDKWHKMDNLQRFATYE